MGNSHLTKICDKCKFEISVRGYRNHIKACIGLGTQTQRILVPKNCEYCGLLQDGSFASGRFCNRVCATRFGPREKREEINKKISLAHTRRKWSIPDFYKFSAATHKKAVI